MAHAGTTRLAEALAKAYKVAHRTPSAEEETLEEAVGDVTEWADYASTDKQSSFDP